MQLKVNEIRSGRELTPEDLDTAISFAVAVVEQQRLNSTTEPLRSFVAQLRAVQVDQRLACLFDWWVTVRLGERSTALAFQLDSHLPEALVSELARLRDMARSCEGPVLVALRSRVELDEVLDTFGEIIHHDQGKVGVQGVTWDQIEDEYAPTLVDIRAGRTPQPPRRTVAEIRSLMDRMEVRRGSEIWRKIERDWRELDETCERAVALATGPARHFKGSARSIDPTSAVSTADGLRQSERLMLADILNSPFGPVPLLLQLVDGADVSTPADLEWLAALAMSGDEVEPPPIPRIEAEIQRLKRVRREIGNLFRSNIDTTEIEFQLALGDISLAERMVDEARGRRATDDRRKGLQRDLDRLRAQVAVVDDGSDYLDRLELIEADIADGVFDEAGEAVRWLRHELQQRTNQNLLDLARDALRAIKEFGGQVDDRLAELVAADDATGEGIEQGDIRELLDAKDQAKTTLRSRSEERCRYVAGRLENERVFLSDTDLADIESALESAESSLRADEIRDADAESRRAARLLDQAVPRVWDSSGGEEKLIEHIRRYLQGRLGFVDADINRLYVGLKTKRFAILSGLTGSGKTTIARLFAESLGATPNNGRFVRVAVRPNWVDETDVLGFVNPNTRRFEPGWLSSLVRTCHQTPDLPVFCLLDEMNLAPVEYYLADYLSAMEEAGSGADVTTLTLYPAGMSPENATDWPARLDFPDNLFILGTVNVDESTRPLSDRVLDRANVIQLSVGVGDSHHQPSGRVDLEARWQVRMTDWRSVCTIEPDPAHHDLLVEVADILAQRLRIGLGVRSHVEIERYVSNAAGIMPSTVALDAAMLQRIIPKIRGFKRDLAEGLRLLQTAFENADASQCSAVINDWLEESVSEDDFLDGTSGRVGLITG